METPSSSHNESNHGRPAGNPSECQRLRVFSRGPLGSKGILSGDWNSTVARYRSRGVMRATFFVPPMLSSYGRPGSGSSPLGIGG